MKFFRAVLRILQSLSPALAAWLAERLFFTAPRRALTPSARAFLATGRRFALTVSGRRIVAWHWGDGRQAPGRYLTPRVAGGGGRAPPGGPPRVGGGGWGGRRRGRGVLRRGGGGGRGRGAGRVRRAAARCRLRGRH